jgi:hypothetical protein
MRALFLSVLLPALLLSKAGAVENVNAGTYNESAPTNSNIANWNSEWLQPVVQPSGTTYTTGWNYVGSVNGNSAVYLGNGWVITCAHVGVGNLTLNGNQGYNVVANSTQTFTHSGNTVDLVMFQVSPAPALPALPIRSTAPVADSSQVAMLGWGHLNGDRDPTWGLNTITQVNQSETLTDNGVTYTSNDFITLTSYDAHLTVTNNYELVIGDSGGGDFIYNSTTQLWELAGINEGASDPDSTPPGTAPYGSVFVQLNTYATQINQLVASTAPNISADAPTMPQWGLIALASLLVAAASFRIWSEKA